MKTYRVKREFIDNDAKLLEGFERRYDTISGAIEYYVGFSTRIWCDEEHELGELDNAEYMEDTLFDGIVADIYFLTKEGMLEEVDDA